MGVEEEDSQVEDGGANNFSPREEELVDWIIVGIQIWEIESSESLFRFLEVFTSLVSCTNLVVS